MILPSEVVIGPRSSKVGSDRGCFGVGVSFRDFLKLIEPLIPWVGHLLVYFLVSSFLEL